VICEGDAITLYTSTAQADNWSTSETGLWISFHGNDDQRFRLYFDFLAVYGYGKSIADRYDGCFRFDV
jgi:hypothetical protein